MGKLVYICIPYTFNPELSFAIANEVAADLMLKGYVVFSPISHSHCIADYLPKEQRNSHRFWMNQDLSIVKKCDELCMVLIGPNGMELIKSSEGCLDEIAKAESQGLPTWFYSYELQNSEQ